MMFFFASRRRQTRCALVTGVQTCALPIYFRLPPREDEVVGVEDRGEEHRADRPQRLVAIIAAELARDDDDHPREPEQRGGDRARANLLAQKDRDRKSTRLNSSH